MGTSFDDLVRYLRQIGAADLQHSQTTYLAHVAGVYRDLKAWGCSEEVCRAGMFHSIYGTEIFQKFTLPLERRDEVRKLIGERGERLAYLNCAIDYASFDRCVARGTPPFTFIDRFTGRKIEITPQDFEDLCTIHLCDILEQVQRSQAWKFRPETFHRLAERLGGVARESYERVYAGHEARAETAS